MNTDMDQETLVRQAVAGDAKALKLLLLDLHGSLCERLRLKIPANMTRLVDAEDIVQETLIEVFRRIRTFKTQGPGSFSRWVSAVALSRLRNVIAHHRTAKRGGGWNRWSKNVNIDESTIALLDSLAAPGRTPSRILAKGEAVSAVHAALAELPEHYQRAIWLIHIEGCSVRTAAETMGRTDRAIHGLCRRGLGLLQEKLGTLLEPPFSSG